MFSSAAAKAVDEQAIRELHDVLLRFALRAVRDRELARELTQDTLLAAIQSRSFAGKSSLRTWLVGILSHKIVDELRRRNRPLDTLDDPDLLARPSEENVERLVAARRELAAVDRALGELPTGERMALLLVEVEEVGRDEACRVLGVTPTHLRVLLHRARHRLRRILDA